MSESNTHIQLVEEMVCWITQYYLNGDRGYLLIDQPESKNGSKPPKINGYIPDVFTACAPNCRTVIGEAKTARDVDRPHSIEQIKAFLRHCSGQKDAVFILATPWPMSRFAKSLLKHLQQQTNSSSVKIVVMEGLAG